MMATCMQSFSELTRTAEAAENLHCVSLGFEHMQGGSFWTRRSSRVQKDAGYTGVVRFIRSQAQPLATSSRRAVASTTDA